MIKTAVYLLCVNTIDKLQFLSYIVINKWLTAADHISHILSAWSSNTSVAFNFPRSNACSCRDWRACHLTPLHGRLTPWLRTLISWRVEHRCAAHFVKCCSRNLVCRDFLLIQMNRKYYVHFSANILSLPPPNCELWLSLTIIWLYIRYHSNALWSIITMYLNIIWCSSYIIKMQSIAHYTNAHNYCTHEHYCESSKFFKMLKEQCS